MMVEDAIAQTAAMAKDLLFDKGGKPKGHDHFLALLTLSTILRPATAAEQAQPGWGQKLFDWDGRPYLYDSGIALAWIEDAEKGDSTADRVLCGAAAVLLTKTATISDLRLRKYAAETLSGDRRIPKKRTRGRSATDNSYRDYAIAFRLIPPLLSRGYHATRSDASKDKLEKRESACSIVCSALKRLRIHLSEKRIEGIWTKFAPHSHQISQMSGTQI
jgi:hypothetical protein